MAKRRTIISVAGLIVLLLASFGFYRFALARSGEEIRKLIDSAYSYRRPGGGRLSAASYTSLSDGALPAPELAKAQIMLLRQANSETRQQLQGLLHLAAGEWSRFVELTRALPSERFADAGFLNNLGVCFLALSQNDASYLVRALDAFERASRLDPKAPEPLFNLVIIYRRLRLTTLADEMLQRYSAVDADSPWHKELTNTQPDDEAEIVEQLQAALSRNDSVEAERLFLATPELWRRVAMQYAIYNQPEDPVLLDFISSQMERRYGDKTVAAMISPLVSDSSDVTVRLRRLINRGAELYAEGKPSESLAAYAEAAVLTRKTSSVFDRLWLDLNQVDTLIRVGNFDVVRTTLARLVATADEHQFLWLKAKAYAVYGTTLRLTSSYTEMLDLLSKADAGFKYLDAPHDRIRVLYYLSAYKHYGGDQDEALRLAFECIQLIGESDAFRLATLDWLATSILHRRGSSEQSLTFAKESVEQSQKAASGNVAGIQFIASTTLAGLYDSMSEHSMASHYLDVADEALDKIPNGLDRIRSELMLGIVKAKIKLKQQQYEEAESLLQRNLRLYRQQPFSATPFLSQTLMLLARTYSETGRVREAGLKFAEAINVVERDDDYLKDEGFRVKFDDERRDLYDSAIEFEYKNGEIDNAWMDLQRYRAKLFLEFLATFNPGMEQTRARLNRKEVQQRIPKDTQILEYALLKDQLLIWLMTEKQFVVRSVPVSRQDIEAKVQAIGEKLRSREDVNHLLIDMGKLLIEPVDGMLDPTRTLTIVPDRALHSLPFGALKQPGKTGYLFERFPIIVSPSLTYFLGSSAAQPSRNTIVGFGSQLNSSSEFKELTSLADVYPSAATFAGPQVDKASFLAGLRNASVFHYAGHSATDAADPLRSAILLDGKRSSPNSVTAIDISQQRMADNAVVILSSCDSSVGNARDGIGVRGLTSAFLIAGAGSVVGSLWPVEASSTADLMIRFHRGFAKDQMPVARALREAQLAFLKAFPERAHPYYWSGFVVTGNFSALR